MRSPRIPDRVPLVSIFGGTLFQLIALYIFIPTNSGGVATEWLWLSNLTMIAGFTFLAVYENLNENDKKIIGMAFLIIKMGGIENTQTLFEELSTKVGGFSIYLGVMLFLNLFLFLC